MTQAKEHYTHLNDLIKESDLLVRDPAFYIDDYFSNLRNTIDLSKEQLIESIEQKHEQIINELNEIQLKCILETQSKKFNKLDKTIQATNEKLLEWSLLMESNRGSECAYISNESIQSINKLKYEIKECQQDLLNNKKYKFKSISSKDSIFGDLITSDAQTVSLIQTLTGHTRSVDVLTVLVNGNLVSGSADSTIKIWNPTSGGIIKTLTGQSECVAALTVLTNGNLVSGSDDNTIKIWNQTTGALIQTLNDHTGYVHALTVLQKGNLVSGSSDKSIVIWS